jgi:hypothetical protein
MSVDEIIKETQINIILDTNIPGEQPFSFTKNVLYGENLDTSKFSEYPYFSSSIIYPESLFANLDYSKRVAFFFEKDVFLKTLKETSEYKTEKQKLDQKKIDKQNDYKNTLARKKKGEEVKLFQKKLETPEEKRDKAIQTNENIKTNVMIMLRLIFPTSFPSSNNIMNSYETLFSNTFLNTSSVTTVIPFLVNIPFGVKTPNHYSYIKSPSKGVCTVIQVTWLNDLYNHPQYKLIVDKYEKFQEWKINESERQNENLAKRIQEFKTKHMDGLKKLKELVDKFDKGNLKQTYYGYKPIDYEKEFGVLKQQVNILVKDNIEVTNLILFKRSMVILEKRLPLETIRKEFNFSKTIEDINEIEMIDYIINRYLDNPDIQIDEYKNPYGPYSENENERELKQRIATKWDGYSKYNEFTQFIKTFIRPDMESSNVFLQTEFENFYKNKDNKIEELSIPSNSTNSEIKPLIETGISIKSKSPIKQEIYVRMDVIAGKLDDSNKSSINCIFNGESLGNELEKLLKTTTRFWELDPNRFFFDLNELNSKTAESKKNESSNQIIPQMNENVVKENKSQLAAPLKVQGGVYKKIQNRKKTQHFKKQGSTQRYTQKWKTNK